MPPVPKPPPAQITGWRPPVPRPAAPPWVLHNEDNREACARMAAGSVDAVVTDPPYGLAFMGKSWDHGVPGAEFWSAFLRVAKPGAYLLAFGGTRTYHRMTCAIEDAGWEVRDCLMWIYGTGFPKGKAQLKPAWEPIVLARKPGPKVLPLGIDECRVEGAVPSTTQGVGRTDGTAIYAGGQSVRKVPREFVGSPAGRWPANVVIDDSDEVMEAFAAFGETRSSVRTPSGRDDRGVPNGPNYVVRRNDTLERGHADSGTAARFFYCAKASSRDRNEGLGHLPLQPADFAGWSGDSMPLRQDGSERKEPLKQNNHPTVKPTELMRWLVRLVCPPGGLVFDPFAGSGSTGKACAPEGRRFVGCESDTDHGYFRIAEERIKAAYAARQ